MTLPALFDWVLQASIPAAILVPAILLLKHLLKNRMDARWHYLIWLLLLARLLMPFAPESSLSVFNAIPVHNIVFSGNAGPAGDYTPSPALHTPPAGRGDIHDPAPGGFTGLPPESTASGSVKPAGDQPAGDQPSGGPGAENQTPGQSGGPVSSGSGVAGTAVLHLIWLGGAAALAVYMLCLNGKLWLKYRKAVPCTDPYLTAIVAECRQELGVKRNPAVITCPEIKSPALFGFLRPKLLLPAGLADSLKREELRCILLHELAHLKRADIAVYWLTGLLQLLHWFNPLVWYGFYRMRQDGEVSCDALVLSRFNPAERVSYGHTMIKLAAAGGGSQPVLLPGLAGIVEEELQIKRRITMISRYKKSSMALTAAGVILLAGLAVFFLTSARSDKTPYDLGSPAKMIIYDGETAIPLDTATDGFTELWEAAKEAIQSVNFNTKAMVDASFHDMAAYAAANQSIILAIIYDKPVDFDFTEGTICRLFIDVNKARLLTSEVKDGSYSEEAFPLLNMDELRAALGGFLHATFHVAVEANPDKGGQVTGGGRYREGETVTVEAIPADGYDFAGWKEDGKILRSFRKKFQFTFSSDEHSGEAVFTGDTRLVAVFEKIEGAHFNRLSFDYEASAIIPRLSPDREHLLGLRDGDFLLYQFPGEDFVNTYTAGEQGLVKEFHWHPQGEAFAYFTESVDQVHLYLMKLNGEREKVISFDRARYGPDWISLDGMDCRVGWIAWALQGEAVALQSRSAEATRFYLVSLDGKILIEEAIEEPYVFLRSPLASSDGRQIAFSLSGKTGQENLWLWNLDDGSLRQVTGANEGDYPFYWVDRSELLVRVGAIGTGGGNYYGLDAIDLADGSRRMIDHHPDRLNLAHSISPGGDYLLGGSYTHGGDNMIYMLQLKSGQRNAILEGYGLELHQVLWQTEMRPFITTSLVCEDEYYDLYSIQHFAIGDEPVTLVQSPKHLHILHTGESVLHYLESNETGSHWFWMTRELHD